MKVSPKILKNSMKKTVVIREVGAKRAVIQCKCCKPSVSNSPVPSKQVRAKMFLQEIHPLPPIVRRFRA